MLWAGSRFDLPGYVVGVSDRLAEGGFRDFRGRLLGVLKPGLGVRAPSR